MQPYSCPSFVTRKTCSSSWSLISLYNAVLHQCCEYGNSQHCKIGQLLKIISRDWSKFFLIFIRYTLSFLCKWSTSKNDLLRKEQNTILNFSSLTILGAKDICAHFQEFH